MPFTSSGSPTLSNSVMRGLSEPNGSWKIIWISLRNGPSSLADIGARSTTVSSRVRYSTCAAGRVDRAQDAARGGGLAAAAFADQAERLALLHGEAHVVDRAHVAGDAPEHALGDREELPQAAHVEQRRVHAGSAALLCRKQLTARRGRITCRAGTAVRSARVSTSSQRGWNGQPGGRLNGCGSVPAITGSAVRVSRLQAGDRAQQRPRVGMLRRMEDVVDRALLHDAAEIHHHHIVRHLRDHAEIVRDEDDRGVVLVLQLAQQRQDLRLRRHVDRGGRFVGDQQARPARQRHGDHRALPQPAGQLPGIGIDALLRHRDADIAEQLHRLRARLLAADGVRAA